MTSKYNVPLNIFVYIILIFTIFYCAGEDLTEIPIEFCSTNCVNGDNCGGPMGFFSVYDAISSKPESVTFSLVHKVTNNKNIFTTNFWDYSFRHFF